MVNYEVNVYSHKTNEYVCYDNYYNSYDKAKENYDELLPTLAKGEEIALYEREVDHNGEEIDNKVLLFEYK